MLNRSGLEANLFGCSILKIVHQRSLSYLKTSIMSEAAVDGRLKRPSRRSGADTQNAVKETATPYLETIAVGFSPERMNCVVSLIPSNVEGAHLNPAFSKFGPTRKMILLGTIGGALSINDHMRHILKPRTSLSSFAIIPVSRPRRVPI